MEWRLLGDKRRLSETVNELEMETLSDSLCNLLLVAISSQFSSRSAFTFSPHPSAISFSLSVMSLPAAPAGWRDVESSVGCPIASTNLLLCKAPLSETRYKVAPKFAFTPKQLIEGEAALGRRVAFIVEVSVRTEADRSSGVGPTIETSQFYDPITELQPHGVRFVHSKIDLTTTPPASSTSDPTQIPCPITDESIQRFVQLIRGLVAATDRETAQQKKKMEEPKDNAPAASSTSSSVSTASLQPYIYIHDIYGYNLVGFLVACYLVEECGMDVITAVNDVADSRPPGIYISSLFQSLVNRYFPGEQASCAPEDVQPIPIIPDLPRPDFHQLPWTGIAAKPATATATNGVGGDEKANETDGVPGETFKRKARKKPTPAPAPVPILSSTAPASMISTPAPPTSLSSAVASVAGVKRSLDGGVDDSSTKRTKLEPSSKPSLALISTFDAASLRRDHPFLIALRPIQVEKLTPILTSLLPQSDITALRAGANIWSLLTPPPLTSTILSHMLNTSSPGHLPPYSLSWIPRHVPCFMLLQRTDVYLIFSPTDWFQVPQLYFPKRKAPNECVNK